MYSVRLLVVFLLTVHVMTLSIRNPPAEGDSLHTEGHKSDLKTHKTLKWHFDENTIPKGSAEEKLFKLGAAEVVKLAKRGVQLQNFPAITEKYIAGSSKSPQDKHKFAMRSAEFFKRILGFPSTWAPAPPPVDWEKIRVFYDGSRVEGVGSQLAETDNYNGLCDITVYRAGIHLPLLSTLVKENYHTREMTDELQSFPSLLLYGLL